MADILHRLGYVRRGHLVSVTRDDLVGQYIGHTAPKTKEVLKKAMGGVLFIDEAYYLHRAENERDYGQESIEILLQVMENQRDDLVVILAATQTGWTNFSPPTPASAAASPITSTSPTIPMRSCWRSPERCWRSRIITSRPMRARRSWHYIAKRREQPHFANARSIRNALDRARLRQANRIFASAKAPLSASELSEISAADILASRVFNQPTKQ